MKSQQQLLSLAYDLLPGFGFFGPRPPFRKSVAVHGKLNRICLFFDSGAVQDYNFPAIHFFDRAGAEIPRASVIREARMSSLHDTQRNEDVLQLVCSGQPLRSGPELRPELTIVFTAPTAIARIEFANRFNHYGRRARHLCVTGYHTGRLVLSHRNIQPERLAGLAADIHKNLRIPLPDTALDAQESAAHCDRLHASILERLDRGTLSWTPRRLAQFLPLFEAQPELTPFRLRIAAEVIIAMMGKRLAIATPSVAPLSTLLSSPERIEQVIAEVNRLLSARQGRPVAIVASKHAIQEPALLRRREGYLAALDRVFPALRACGVTPMLCYGSLLGAVRENAFIGHDDDVDVLYVDGSRSREEMLSRRAELIERLSAHGFRSDGIKDIVNFHIWDENGRLDLFPCWQEDEQLQVMMKYPTYRSVPASMILPVGEVSLHDRIYPAPADPEAFLRERYGSDWRIPDPYHEWPWRLTDADKASSAQMPAVQETASAIPDEAHGSNSPSLLRTVQKRLKLGR